MTRYAARLPMLVATMWLAACAVGPDYKPPSPDLPADYRYASSDPAFVHTAEVEARWWRQFQDPALSSLVEKALATNYDIQIAAARLREARAARRRAGWRLFPSGGISAAYGKQRSNYVKFFGDNDQAIRTFDYYEAGFDAAWELDVFGGVRRGIQAAAAAQQASAAELGAARVSVVAETARAYFELRRAQARRAVAQRNLRIQQRTVELTQVMLDEGVAARVDTLRAQAQLRATQARLPDIRQAVVAAQLRLAVLTAQTPGSFEAPADTPTPSRIQTVSIPSPGKLIRQRPDIRAAERRLAAANARIGVAVAQQFPQVSISGLVGLVSVDLGDLFTSDAVEYTARPAISWPIFDLGRVRARIEANKARTEGALAAYKQTVLQALEEVEGALSAYGKARERLQRVNEQTNAQSRAARLARLRFEQGDGNFLDVLDAQRTLLAAETDLVDAKTRLNLTAIAIYKALGGGWDPASNAHQRSPSHQRKRQTRS